MTQFSCKHYIYNTLFSSNKVNNWTSFIESIGFYYPHNKWMLDDPHQNQSQW